MTLLVGESESTSPSVATQVTPSAGSAAYKGTSGTVVPYTAAASGTATTAALLLPSSGSRSGSAQNISIGLFNAAGTVLLAQSATISIPSTYAGWVTGAISYPIVAGTQYGLGVISDGALFCCALSGIGDVSSAAGTFPSFTGVTLAGGAYYSAVYPVMYIDGTVGPTYYPLSRRRRTFFSVFFPR